MDDITKSPAYQYYLNKINENPDQTAEILSSILGMTYAELRELVKGPKQPAIDKELMDLLRQQVDTYKEKHLVTDDMDWPEMREDSRKLACTLVAIFRL